MKHLAKKTACLLPVLVAGLSFSSCHKTCECRKYNGAVVEYTDDVLDSLGTTCDNMVYQANEQYYSVCSWE